LRLLSSNNSKRAVPCGIVIIWYDGATTAIVGTRASIQHGVVTEVSDKNAILPSAAIFLWEANETGAGKREPTTKTSHGKLQLPSTWLQGRPLTGICMTHSLSRRGFYLTNIKMHHSRYSL
jgi:hypothetical protein